MKYLPPTKKTGHDVTKFIATNNRIKNHAAKSVQTYIATFYNEDKGYSFPSMNTIEENTGASRSTIRRAIVEMEASGLWYVAPGKWNKAEKKNYNNKYYPLAWTYNELPDGSVYIPIGYASAKDTPEGSHKGYYALKEIEGHTDAGLSSLLLRNPLRGFEKLETSKDYVERLLLTYPGLKALWNNPEGLATLVRVYEGNKEIEAPDIIFHFLAENGIYKELGRAFNSMVTGSSKERVQDELIKPTLQMRELARKQAETKKEAGLF